MRIVVSGSTGQLGKALQNVFPTAIFLDRASLDLTALSGDIKEAIVDLAPDIFINAAAYTAVDQAETEVTTAFRINGIALRGITNACRHLNAYLIHLSTDYVFDIYSDIDHREDEKTYPSSIYGKSKRLGEEFVREYENATIIRTSWLFGDGHNFVRAILNKAHKEPTISVINDQRGRPTYAPDLAVAIKNLISLRKYQKLPSIVHIQNEGGVVSWAEYTEEIIRLSKLNCQVKAVSTQEYERLVGKKLAPRPYHSVFDMELLHSLGIEMPYWRESLVKYLNT